MKLVWFDEAWTEYLYWQAQDDAIVEKINGLIKDTTRSPASGVGKPEPLRGQLTGWWSRRITHEHRLVYRVAGSGDEQRLEILGCRSHY